MRQWYRNCKGEWPLNLLVGQWYSSCEGEWPLNLLVGQGYRRWEGEWPLNLLVGQLYRSWEGEWPLNLLVGQWYRSWEGEWPLNLLVGQWYRSCKGASLHVSYQVQLPLASLHLPRAECKRSHRDKLWRKHNCLLLNLFLEGGNPATGLMTYVTVFLSLFCNSSARIFYFPWHILSKINGLSVLA